ncbi:hypothetical protein PsYK624_110860 [Phanerochaete sordida]|uniref:Uncharacterized protein n=1 Tax=Phanerochaete sordida TaxID=48140 RepID=A0A9P3GH56_9APHY|nr:hypothetical protein PsYK624_110860 [Phanerochaete sordida]
MLLAKVFTLLRSLVMNALDERLPSDTHALLELRKPDEDPKSRTEVYVEDAGVDTEERARMRRRFMIVFRAVSAAVLLVVILGIVSGNTYTKAETDSGKATLVKVLRQAATVISFLLVLFQHGLLVYVYYTIRRIRRVALLQLFATSAIVIIVPIYHLIIMSNKTTSLTSTERGSQNTSVDKVAFYVLQAAPEFLASAALLSTNVKIMFGMGWFGGRQHAGEA